MAYPFLNSTGNWVIHYWRHPLGGEVIAKALKVFHDWNPGYKPDFCMANCDQADICMAYCDQADFCMADCDQAEANALTEVFLNSPLF